MTRIGAWISVLGVLLVGIVALNVVTLSFAASSGQIYQNIGGPRTGQFDRRRPRCADVRDGATQGEAAPRRGS